MPLNSKQKQHLKSLAHALKPIILIGGNGLTDAVKKETDRALKDHELIKIRIQGHEREERTAIFAEICESLQAELVQVIGNMAVIFRENPEE